MTGQLVRSVIVIAAAMVVAQPLLDASQRGRNAERRNRSWELLGTRSVSDKVDHDVITVTASRGTFRALRIAVEGRAVQFREVKVVFANGDAQDVALRAVIPAGGESRVIDISGPGDRVIRRVEFTYDAQSLGGSATVRLFGRN